MENNQIEPEQFDEKEQQGKINEQKRQSETEAKPEKDKKKMFVVAAIAVVIVLLLGLGFGIYAFQQKKAKELTEKHQKQVSSLREQVQKLEADKKIVPDNTKKENNNAAEIVEGENLGKITVDWEDELIEVKEANCPEGSTCFLAGKIVKGDERLVGNALYLEMIPGMGYSFEHYAVYEQDGKDYQVRFEDSETPIAGISDIPEEIDFPDTNYKLKKYEWISRLFSDIKTTKKVFTNNLGDFYLTEEGCLAVELPDHTVQTYDLVIPFVNKEDRILNITFNGSGKNNQEYSYIRPACGSSCNYLVEDNSVEGELEVVAKSNNGEDIYGIKDKNIQVLKDLYNDKNTVAYFGEDWSDKLEQSKYTYEEFLSMHPLLYWKDPLGRRIRFSNDKFQVAAEMCKPVMYFYSPEEARLSIRVSPNGGFTHTEPEYGDGWDMNIIPGGKVKDNKSGKVYESLLWEGMALGYQKPKEGWVIRKGELGQFFDKKLNELGLNNRETSDFKDYWLSRLNEKDYYRISFLNQSDFDELAPLEFSPIQPENIIRVMMIAEGVDNFENISPQNFSISAERNGLTVVEWGGILER